MKHNAYDEDGGDYRQKRAGIRMVETEESWSLSELESSSSTVIVERAERGVFKVGYGVRMRRFMEFGSRGRELTRFVLASLPPPASGRRHMWLYERYDKINNLL